MNAKVASAVIERAAGRCECGCEMPFNDSLSSRMELDHFRGRARSETKETVWALRAECHRSKTDNYPSAAYWFARYGVFCKRNGYLEELGQALEELSWRTAKKRTA